MSHDRDSSSCFDLDASMNSHSSLEALDTEDVNQSPLSKRTSQLHGSQEASRRMAPRKRAAWKREIRLVGDIFHPKSNLAHAESPSLADFATIVGKSSVLLWMTQHVFCFSFKLRNLPNEFECHYYMHLSSDASNRDRSCNLYIHSQRGRKEEALRCLEQILSMEDTGFDYISVTCIGTNTNFLLPTTWSSRASASNVDMSSQCIVQHQGQLYNAMTCENDPQRSSLAMDVMGLFMGGSASTLHRRWIILSDIYLTNDQARFLASGSAKLSLNNAAFEDGGYEFLRAYRESGRRIRGLRIQKNPFYSNAMCASFLSEIGHPSCQVKELEILSLSYQDGILSALSKALRVSKSLRALYLWWTTKKDEKLFLLPAYDSLQHPKSTCWEEFLQALKINKSLTELTMESTWCWKATNVMPYVSMVSLTKDIAAVLRSNPRIQHVPFHHKLHDLQLWETEVRPVLRGEYHTQLIRQIQKEADHWRAGLLGQLLSHSVSTNPTLIYCTLQLHTDVVVQHQL